MKKLIQLLSTVLFLLVFSSICFGQSCNRLPTNFSSYGDAIRAIKASSFKKVESMRNDSWIQKASFFSCNGETGYLIVEIDYHDYLFKNVELHLWNEFKDASSKGNFYNTYLKKTAKYHFRLNEDDLQSEEIIKTLSPNEATFVFGLSYLRKESKDYNPVIAFDLIKEAAENSWIPSFVILAKLYDTGLGTLMDKNKAFYWYKRAAENGNSDAQLWVGIMYQKGEGTLKDIYSAFRWYKKSAENNNSDAQYIVGYLYFNGGGTDVNEREAAKWVKKAYENGNTEAKNFWESSELWKY